MIQAILGLVHLANLAAFAGMTRSAASDNITTSKKRGALPRDGTLWMAPHRDSGLRIAYTHTIVNSSFGSRLESPVLSGFEL